MSDSRLEKTQLMFPQVRNLHNKVFGGYLMRLAYEVSWGDFVAVYLSFAHSRGV